MPKIDNLKSAKHAKNDYIEKYFEQPDWLLPHLNGKRIHTQKIIYIGKD